MVLSDVIGTEGLEPSNDGTKTRCLTCLATPQRDKDFLEGGNLTMRGYKQPRLFPGTPPPPGRRCPHPGRARRGKSRCRS